MTPERMFQELLGLGLNWEVVESRFNHKTSTVVLEIRETARLWETERCPKEGGLVYCYDHTEELVWRHMNVFQHRCEIRCRLPRKKCRQCGGVYRVRPPWEGLSGHFSREFEAYALLLMREMPVSQVGKLVGENDTRLWRMLFKHVEGAYAEADFCNVCCVGVDELNVRKGHEYVSVFADLLAKRVIFVTEGKDKSTWERFVQALEAHNGHRHTITQASMDMSQAYRSGVAQTCRNAQVVFDKFHVICHANEAVDQARRAEIRYGARGAQLAAQPMALAQEPGKLDRGGAGSHGAIGPGESRHGQSVSDAARLTGHLSVGERAGSPSKLTAPTSARRAQGYQRLSSTEVHPPRPRAAWVNVNACTTGRGG